MKKFFALLCAGVMACSMSMMAFAAPSQTTGNVTDNATGNASQTTSTTTSGSAAAANNNGHSTVDSVKVWSNIVIDGVESSNAALSVEGSSRCFRGRYRRRCMGSRKQRNDPADGRCKTFR